MPDDMTAYIFSRIRAHTPAAQPQGTPSALHLLLMAWLIDDTALPLMAHCWLKVRLADRAWVPTPNDCATLAPGLLAWAARLGIEATARLALDAHLATTQPGIPGEGA